MKIIYKSIVILIALLITSSCVNEEMIKADPSFILSFQRDGQTDALAGTPFYIIPIGSGEFLTLYDGSQGHVWGDKGAKGIDFNKSDSLSVKFNVSGKYKLTLVTSSSGNFGKDFTRNIKTVEVNVIDLRNSITVFAINDIDGVFAPNNEILFSVPDVVTDFKFTAFFGLDSGDSKAYINGQEQTSGVTINDFAQPVVYTIKSLQGVEKNYTVKFTTFPSSDEKKITQFELGSGGNGEIGLVDETTKIINLTVNYASNPTSVKLIISSSYGSTIYLNSTNYSSRKFYNLSAEGINKIKVVAQNNTEVEYALKVILDNPVSKFTFIGLVPAPSGVIDIASKTITVDVLKGTDITKLAAEWTGTIGKVTVENIVQTNGITLNDFSIPVTYTFYKGTSTGDKYEVIVNVK